MKQAIVYAVLVATSGLFISCDAVEQKVPSSGKPREGIEDMHPDEDSMSMNLDPDANEAERRDAGRRDAGTPRTDAGVVTVDAGTPRTDAGSTTVDAGPVVVVDAGTPRVDAGTNVSPCAAFEPNETVRTAAVLTPGTYSKLAICGNDVDVFAVNVPANSVMTAGIEFKNSVGDLDLYITDGTLIADGGMRIVARSAGEADGEEVPNIPSLQARTLYIIARGWLRPDAGTPDNGEYALSIAFGEVNRERDCLENCRDMVQLEASPTQSSTQARSDGYYRVSPAKYVWARRDLLGMIKYGVRAVQARFPASATDAVGISDIAQADGKTPGTDVGSPRHPTTTHVRGRDADIAYFQTDSASNYQIICGDGSDNNNNGVAGRWNDGYFCTTPNNIVDIPRQIWFMAKLAETSQYRVVGIDQTLVTPFTNEAKRLLDRGEITLGQYRRITDGLGYGSEGGWQFHHHHIHVSLNE